MAADLEEPPVYDSPDLKKDLKKEASDASDEELLTRCICQPSYIFGLPPDADTTLELHLERMRRAPESGLRTTCGGSNGCLLLERPLGSCSVLFSSLSAWNSSSSSSSESTRGLRTLLLYWNFWNRPSIASLTQLCVWCFWSWSSCLSWIDASLARWEDVAAPARQPERQEYLSITITSDLEKDRGACRPLIVLWCIRQRIHLQV